MAKSHAAGRVRNQPTLAQIKELVDQGDRGVISREELQVFLRHGQPESLPWEIALDFMDDAHFWGIHAVDRIGFKLCDRSTAEFEMVAFSALELHQARMSGDSLVASPGVSVVTLRRYCPFLIGNWYLTDSEKSAFSDLTPREGYLLAPLLGRSTNGFSWEGEVSRLAEGWTPLSAAEVVYLAALQLATDKEYTFFGGGQVWTDSVTSEGDRVIVSVENGLIVIGYSEWGWIDLPIAVGQFRPLL